MKLSVWTKLKFDANANLSLETAGRIYAKFKQTIDLPIERSILSPSA